MEQFTTKQELDTWISAFDRAWCETCGDGDMVFAGIKLDSKRDAMCRALLSELGYDLDQLTADGSRYDI